MIGQLSDMNVSRAISNLDEKGAGRERLNTLTYTNLKKRVIDPPVLPIWGKYGIKIWIVRCRINALNIFHWGIIMECIQTKICIVINRDLGLDITYNCNFS